MATIPVYRGGKVVAKALIDSSDELRCSEIKWYLNSDGYVVGYSKELKRSVLLHRFVLGVPDGVEVDHIHGIRLDCRRSQLRVASRAQNQWNVPKKAGLHSSRYKGVDWHGARARWRARIRIGDGQRLELGHFKSETDAARAYNDAAVIHHGQFARLNDLALAV